MRKYLVGLFLILVAVGFFFLLKSKPIVALTSTTPQSKISRDQITSLMILHTSGTDPEKLASFVSKYRPAGFILMSDNIPETPEKLKALTARLQQASPGLLIAIDQEGCSVKRLPQDNFLCANTLKDLPVKDTETAFTQRAKLLADNGINLNFGIVADVTADKKSFIYPRVFGSDPLQAGQRVAAATRASKPYTLSTIKHFPGHGETVENTHDTLALVSIDKETWQQRDLPPFQAGINAEAELVMFGHLNYTFLEDAPATLSPKWHTLLREELNYDGATITDDMIMLQKTHAPEYQDVVNNTIQAINAGNDIILFVNDYNLEEEPERNIDVDALIDGVLKAANNGEISEQRLKESAERVNQLR